MINIPRRYKRVSPVFRVRLFKRAESILDEATFCADFPLAMLPEGERRKVKRILLASMLFSDGRGNLREKKMR